MIAMSRSQLGGVRILVVEIDAEIREIEAGGDVRCLGGNRIGVAGSRDVSGGPARGRDVTEPGRTVFFSQGCYGCHRVGVAGTPIANDLSQVGRKYTDAEIAQWLRDPASQKPTAHMPRLALTEDEIRALAAYLGALR
jgi:mono/diheme cytochrome c family protein